MLLINKINKFRVIFRKLEIKNKFKIEEELINFVSVKKIIKFEISLLFFIVFFLYIYEKESIGTKYSITLGKLFQKKSHIFKTEKERKM